MKKQNKANVIAVRVDAPTMKYLEKEASLHDISISQLIRRLISQKMQSK